MLMYRRVLLGVVFRKVCWEIFRCGRDVVKGR